MKVKIVFNSEMWEIYPIESDRLDVLGSAVTYDEICDICREKGYDIIAIVTLDDEYITYNQLKDGAIVDVLPLEYQTNKDVIKKYRECSEAWLKEHGSPLSFEVFAYDMIFHGYFCNEILLK